MLGVRYLLPVNPILGYEGGVDEHMLPVPRIPAQNMEPWQRALVELNSDRGTYESISREARSAALAHISTQSVDSFCDYLQALRPKGVTSETVV